MGTGRIITEFFRTTPKVFWGLTMAQLISIGLITIACGLILKIAFGREKLSPAKKRAKGVRLTSVG
jgi:prolipoprotein diacylglyceryltransferase